MKASKSRRETAGFGRQPGPGAAATTAMRSAPQEGAKHAERQVDAEIVVAGRHERAPDPPRACTKIEQMRPRHALSPAKRIA